MGAVLNPIYLIFVLLITYVNQNFARNVDSANINVGKDWWKNTVVYQVYPRSFCDNDGDGVGDLLGIASKADYFKDLGVETVWLSPIYKSPMADFGYDISDYKDVDPIFGTLDDFDTLIDEMHKKERKVVLDFVPNHSSNQHDWFLKSLQNDTKYKDYYIWRNASGFNETGHPIPPNNWLSIFRYSAWEWSEERQQFYFHQFLKEQPDLNYRNPEVVEEMKNVLRFWLDKGVDGFRVDAISTLFEVEDVYNNDEPRNTMSGETDPTKRKYLDDIYTENQPETFTIIDGWKQVLNEYGNKLFMLEVYNEDPKMVMRYYGDATQPISDFPFNFYLVTKLTSRSSVTGTNLRDTVRLWLDNMPEGFWPNWVLGNHDNKRIASRTGSELIDALNMFTFLLPGTPITYYGEEIGMEDTEISYEDTQDPAGCHNGPEHYTDTSRDPERTPMQWDDTPFAGFTNGSTTWLTVNEDYITVNVKSENEADQSHLKVYKELIKIRENEAFRSGWIEFQLATEDALVYVRSFNNETKYIITINTSEQDNTIDATQGAVPLPSTATVVLRSSTDTRPETEVGATIQLSDISLLPGEGIVLEAHGE